MVMHARKPQRLNDGYFEKHQPHSYQSSKYNNSKRDYDRDRASNYRDRDLSPIVGGSLNNGNSSYRSQSPEIDSPSSRGHGGSHDIRERADHRGGGSAGGDRFSYIQKMRDRDRDLYKKDKYLSDKRDRRNDRDSESHRTNHDRIDRRNSVGVGAKLSSSNSGEKRSGSDDRDRDRLDRDRDIRENKRDRDRDRDRDRERERDRDRNERSGDRERDRGNGGGGGVAERNERGERVARCGDWSEHVSSSGKMYYYNCKTEVSQWEKPKEWIERERNLARDQHREKDYREKDRERDREDRFSRSAYPKHSNSRGISRLRWNNYDNDNGPPNIRRRLDGRLADSNDMDISPGDSTPTSEASYPLQGTPTTHAGGNQHNDHCATSLSSGSLPNALPRLASHPNVNNLSSSSTLASGTMHFLSSPVATASGTGVVVGGATMLPSTGLASTPTSATAPPLSGGGNAQTQNCNHKKLESVAIQSLGRMGSPIATGTNQLDHHLNSNTPGPPKLGTKEAQDLVLNSQPQKNSLHMPPLGSEPPPGSAASSMDVCSGSAVPHGMISLRENAMNSPLYNMTHSHVMSDVSYTKSPVISVSSGSSIGHTNNSSGVTGTVNASGVSASYSSNSQLGLKTVEGGNGVTNSIGNSSLCPSSSLTNIAATASAGSGLGTIPGEGPPTPTQELDVSGMSAEQQQQRKNDNTSSASLSTLQSCVQTSAPAVRSQGSDIQPKSSKYFRPDLIIHATNWAAEALEKQAQKLADERYLIGDLLCSKACSDLKIARSLARINEISAVLQEQKLLHLREQVHRLEEKKMDTLFPADTP